MKKTILILILLTNFIFAKNIFFTEIKYINSLDSTFTRKGTISFLKNKIILKYNNFNEKLIYKNDKLFIKNKNSLKEIQKNNHVNLQILFLLINSIHKNNFLILEQYFNILNSNKEILLKPKKNLTNYIEYIKFKKNTKLEYINILLKNKDYIKIRQD